MITVSGQRSNTTAIIATLLVKDGFLQDIEKIGIDPIRALKILVRNRARSNRAKYDENVKYLFGEKEKGMTDNGRPMSVDNLGQYIFGIPNVRGRIKFAKVKNKENAYLVLLGTEDSSNKDIVDFLKKATAESITQADIDYLVKRGGATKLSHKFPPIESKGGLIDSEIADKATERKKILPAKKEFKNNKTSAGSKMGFRNDKKPKYDK